MSSPTANHDRNIAGLNGHSTLHPPPLPPGCYDYYSSWQQPYAPPPLQTTTTVTTITSPSRPTASSSHPVTAQFPQPAFHNVFYPGLPPAFPSHPHMFTHPHMSGQVPFAPPHAPPGTATAAASNTRKRGAPSGESAPKRRRTAKKAAPAISEDTAPVLPGVGPSVLPSQEAPSKLTFRSWGLHPKERSVAVATDVWHFVRALTSRERPADWVEPTSEQPEATFTTKPRTAFVGCRLCTGYVALHS